MKTKLPILSLLALLALPAAVQAQFTFTTNNDGSLNIYDYTGSGGAVVIPDETNGLQITSIGDEAFYDYGNVTSITLPDSVVTIGNEAFYECYDMTNVTIGTNVTSIGNGAFQQCHALTSIILPNSVTSIGNGAFANCITLTNVTISSSVTNIGSSAFAACDDFMMVYFQGNAPTPTNDTSVFSGDANAIVYFLQGTTGWGATFDGIPTALWTATIPPLALGITTVSSLPVVVWSACATNCVLQMTTNLASGDWVTVTNTPQIVGAMCSVQVDGSQPCQFFRLIQNTATADGMALIPAGSFTIGDSLDGESDAIPTNVYVSAFYMDTNLVSYGQWTNTYSYAINNGYGFDHAGFGRATNYPVQIVSWYDVVKWCNARSQQAGLTPVYYTDPNLTQLYTNGNTDAVYPNWTVNGYRLPTEAEWEKAARGGLSGKRFPWGDTISESQANYYGNTGYSYDLGPNGYNINFFIPPNNPNTSPVGYFAANGYGLNDMAGNLFEWCWDWDAGPAYPIDSPYLGGTDPRGPVGPFTSRISRGGDKRHDAYLARCAYRGGASPNDASAYSGSIGFRCVRGL